MSHKAFLGKCQQEQGLAQTQHCSRGSCALHLALQRWRMRMAFMVFQRHTHSAGTSCQPKSCHCHKTSSSIRVLASVELHHISSPCLQGGLSLLSGGTAFSGQQLPGEGGFTPTPALCGEAWMLSGLETSVTFCHLLSPAPRFNASTERASAIGIGLSHQHRL